LVTFTPVTLTEIQKDMQNHLISLSSAIDSFLEGHILESTHYTIKISDANSGFASIHKGSLMTQFVLFPKYRKHGQNIFSQLKKMEEVQSAFVPTCDEFFLSHAIDDYRTVVKQAYFFAHVQGYGLKTENAITIRLADNNDINLIQDKSGDFFGDKSEIEHKVKKNELFITHAKETCVGFGIMEKSRLMDSVASIGMFVIPEYRQKGIGTAILQSLIATCETQNIRPVAGCWYYNHLSKKTLERAGMFTQTRLLKIDF
jgi:GNAT superfamily N-acetyltransferase